MKHFFAIILLSSFGHISFAEPEWPKPNFKSCEFYPKVENIMKCELDGRNYLRGYGEHYCNRFKEESKKWSDNLKKWVNDTGQCLQEMIYDNRSKRLDSCENMEEFAFDVHPICYKQYGICKLKPEEYWQLKDLVRSIDINNTMKNFRRSRSQFFNVFNSCLSVITNNAEDTLFDLFFSQLGPSEDKKLKTLAGKVFTDAPKITANRTNYFKNALAITLFDENSESNSKATELFSEQYSQTTATNDAKKNTLNCFADLRAGKQSKFCEAEIAKAYAREDLNKKTKAPETKITEKKLLRILNQNTAK